MDNNSDRKTAFFTFFGTLNDFLPARKRSQPIRVNFRGRQSVKHLIESLGVPHVEVGKIIVAEKSVDFDYLVRNEEYVQVFPYSPPLDLPKSNHSQTDELIRFVADNHLGRLAAYMRMLGFDTLYRSDIQDEELAAIACQDGRVLLTRDHRLLMRSCIQYGYWVRSKLPRLQIREIVQRWNLAPLVRPFRRCIRCNGLLISIEKERILDQLQPLTRLYFEDFRICPQCQQIYWKGSHFERMSHFIEQTLDEVNIE